MPSLNSCHSVSLLGGTPEIVNDTNIFGLLPWWLWLETSPKWVMKVVDTTYTDGGGSKDFRSSGAAPEDGVFSGKVVAAFNTTFTI
ncbi:hypothetical protein TSUD_156990 [Trifolium subterraneum]|uniref:Uncharacterized protein n=1 Tax=Trifolium subterraneum TaxID=3900 RepID=A0A2Z6MU83_TRISU|nr:hypothetical protein TSUD_156990 [Trifolium subterraneum]